jgi:hypothetical protein
VHIEFEQEIQRLNENLQTTSEEMQTSQEELYTVNVELQSKIDDSISVTSDIGRHFTDLATNLNYPELIIDAKEVLRTLMFLEKTISSTDGIYYTIRIMPYRTFEDKIEGLIITFLDITEQEILIIF